MARLCLTPAKIVRAWINSPQDRLAGPRHRVLPKIIAGWQNNIFAQFQAFTMLVNRQHSGTNNYRQKQICKPFHTLKMVMMAQNFKIGARPC